MSEDQKLNGLSADEEAFEKLKPAVAEQAIVFPETRPETPENLAAAGKIAERLRAANVDLPPEVWKAIEEGRTADFQNHPDFMVACRAMALGGWRAKTGPSEGLLFSQPRQIVSAEPAIAESEGQSMLVRLPCPTCRGLHSAEKCFADRETRWQHFKSSVVRAWRRFCEIFRRKSKASILLPPHQRNKLPALWRQKFPKGYDGAKDAVKSVEIAGEDQTRRIAECDNSTDKNWRG